MSPHHAPQPTGCQYRRLAEQHRPHDEQALRAAAVELAGCGLTAQDVGEVLPLSPTVVSRWLAEGRS